MLDEKTIRAIKKQLPPNMKFLEKEKYPKIKIKDTTEKELDLTLEVEIDLYGDGTDVSTRKITMPWKALQPDPNGVPQYKIYLRDLVEREKWEKLHRNEWKQKAPKKGEELNFDDVPMFERID